MTTQFCFKNHVFILCNILRVRNCHRIRRSKFARMSTLVLFFFFNGLYSKCKNKPSDLFRDLLQCTVCVFSTSLWSSFLINSQVSFYLASWKQMYAFVCVLCVYIQKCIEVPVWTQELLGKHCWNAIQRKVLAQKDFLSQEVMYMIWGKGVTYLLCKCWMLNPRY